MAYSASPAVGIELVRVRNAFYLVSAYVGAVVLRLLTLDQYLVQIDEPASLLAIQRVADSGVPLLPSGVLYLQGALFSYLAAPLAWFSEGDALLHSARLLNIALSSLIVPLTMMLVYRLTRSGWVAAFTGLLVACDPNLMIWSVAIRPYGLLAVETVALVYCFVVLVEEGRGARLGPLRFVVWLPILSLAGTFTHVGYWLAVPALGIITLMVWRMSLFSGNRPILLSGIASAFPLVLFLILGRAVGIGSGTGSEEGISSAFVGSHLFNLEQWTQGPKLYWHMWLDNFQNGQFHDSMPFFLAGLSGVLLVRALDPAEGRNGPALASIVAVHWSIIGIVIVFVTSDPAPRYVNQAMPLGYLIAGIAVWLLWSTVTRHVRGNTLALRAILMLVIVLPMTLYAVSAGQWRTQFPGGDPSYWEANRWLAEHHDPGQVVITTLPPASPFWFGDDVIEQDFRFLAGPAGSSRSVRYTKVLRDGTEGDYWLGIPSLNTEAKLCAELQDHAGNAWIIVDWGRLNAPWAFRGVVSDIVLGSSDVWFNGSNGVLALFVRSADTWTPEATAGCKR